RRVQHPRRKTGLPRAIGVRWWHLAGGLRAHPPVRAAALERIAPWPDAANDERLRGFRQGLDRAHPGRHLHLLRGRRRRKRCTSARGSFQVIREKGMKNHSLRIGIVSLLAALLLSCGGGGGGGGGTGAVFGNAGVGAPLAGAGSPAPAAQAAPSGNGLGGIAADDGSGSATTTAASGGDDGSGVGSGGTGVSTADATGIGAVDGAGS